jgi:hypothetical protein
MLSFIKVVDKSVNFLMGLDLPKSKRYIYMDKNLKTGQVRNYWIKFTSDLKLKFEISK